MLSGAGRERAAGGGSSGTATAAAAGAGATAGAAPVHAAAATAKRGLDYKMAKKVAELTQVVHMLFTRNHEHEVELHALRQLYAAELRRLAEERERAVAAAERERSAAIADSEERATAAAAALRSQHERDAAARDADWSRRLEAKEQLAAANRAEVQQLRDLLIGAQRDIELLRKGALESADGRALELQQREQECERLARACAAAERRARDAEQRERAAAQAAEQAAARTEAELQRRQSMLDEATTNGDALRQRCAQADAEARALRRELAKRDQEVASLRRASVAGGGTPGAAAGVAGAAAATSSSSLGWESSDELERLRREVQRYRLELRNREGNFNRMFTNSMPVLVDVRAGAFNGGGVDRAGEPLRLPTSGGGVGVRPTKAFSYALSQSFDDVAEERREAGAAKNLSQRLPPMRTAQAALSLTRSLTETRPKSKDLLVQYSRKSAVP